MLIVGCGIQSAGHATPSARCVIERAERVFYAVADPTAERWVRELNACAEPLPYPWDESERLETYMAMAERVHQAVRAGQRVCVVLYGHPGVLVTPAYEMIRRVRGDGHEARMLPGVSSLACLFADLEIDPGADGCHIYEANDFLVRRRAFDVYTPLILCQIALIGNASFFDSTRTERIRGGLAALGEVLCQAFPPEHRAVLYEAAVWAIDPPRAERVALRDLAGARVSERTTLYVPPVSRAPVDTSMRDRLAALASLPTAVAASSMSGSGGPTM